MLKLLFSALLLANVLLFAYVQGYLEELFPGDREPDRLQQQLGADKIRLIPATPPAPAGARAVEEAPEPAPAAEAGQPVQPTPAVVTPEVPVAAAPDSAEVSCLEIGNFSPAEARRFAARLAPLQLGERLSRRPAEESMSYMVHLPPQVDDEAASKKANELRQMGIRDFYIIQDDSPYRRAISLGVFKQVEAAQVHLAELNKKGLRGARIGERPMKPKSFVFRIHQPDAAVIAHIEQLGAIFPGQATRACAAE